MTGHVTIRRAQLADAPLLSRLGAKTFAETFDHYPAPILKRYLSDTYNPQEQRKDIANHQVQLAFSDGQIAGFAQMGTCKLPIKPVAEPAVELHRLYIQKAFHRRGIGAALVAEFMRYAASKRAKSLYVGVWEHNHNAQAFYTAQGFSKVGEYGFPVGPIMDREFILYQPVSYRLGDPEN